MHCDSAEKGSFLMDNSLGYLHLLLLSITLNGLSIKNTPDTNSKVDPNPVPNINTIHNLSLTHILFSIVYW